MRLISAAIILALTPGSEGAAAQIVINELLPSPSGAQEEFVELLNAGGDAVRISDIAIRDARSDWIAITAAPDFLEPGELLVLSADDQPVWPDVSIVHPVGWASLNNSGDSLLVSVKGVVTDRAGYESNERGRSLERIDPNVPGHVGSNWAHSEDPSGATPGRLNSRYSLDTAAPVVRGVEYVPYDGLLIWMSEPVDPGSMVSAVLSVDGRALNPAKFVVEDARIRLPWTSAESPVSMTVGGLSDWAGHVMRDTTAAVASPAVTGDVYLTEMLVEAGTGQTDLPEFIELTAVGRRPVSLRGGRLLIGSDPEPDVVPLSPPDSTRILGPGEILVVYSSPASGPAASNLRTIVQDAIQPHAGVRVQIFGADPTDIALRNSSDLVRLVSAAGELLDIASYDDGLTDIRFADHRGRSIRRVAVEIGSSSSWSSTLDDSGTTPGRAPDLRPGPPGPSPGDLIFSELMYSPLADPHDGRPDQPEYIEVANVSGRAVSLNGLQLAGHPADDGSTDARRMIFQPVILPPDGVAVVYDLPGSVSDDAASQRRVLTNAFPDISPDAFQDKSTGQMIPVRGLISLANDGERLRLLAADCSVVDDVAYSPAMHHPAVVDPTGRALERTVLSLAPLRLGGWSTSTAPGGGSPGLLPRRPGPPPSPASAGLSAGLAPRTITPDGDGIDDLTVVRVDNLPHGAVVRVDIVDLDGRIVRTLTPGVLATDSFALEWSGLDDARRPLARGFYVVLVRIMSANGARLNAFRLPLALAR